VKLPYLAVFAAFFLRPGTDEQSAAFVHPPTNLVVVAAQPEVLPLGPVVDVLESTSVTNVTAPQTPTELRAIVNSKAGVKILTLVHRGHLITLRRGEMVALGENSISIPLKDAASIVWESSERKTFDTVRGVVEWDEQAGKFPIPRLVATDRMSPMREISSARHDCKAFAGTNEVITVICRIDSLAVGAVRAFGDKPLAGITSVEVGEHRYFRMDLDTHKDDFDAVVIGYSDGVRGHVIRAEASKLPGETNASFSLLAATRAQPAAIPRRFFHHRPHEHFDSFL
jgi:hypothetical protein